MPGDAGPDAIADVLAGDVNPGGKLPISFPRHVGQVPLTTGTTRPAAVRTQGRLRRRVRGAAVAVRVRPVLHDVRASRTCGSTGPQLPADGGEVTVSVDVANTGTRAGDEVVQLYVRDEAATVARPVLELRGFRRVGLEPGERRTVSFRLSTEQFAYVGADYRRVIEAGTIRIHAGTSSASLPLSATLTVTGPDVHLVDRCRFLTETTVE